VIFDLDGTLVDSNELHVQAWDRAFRKFGKQFALTELRSQIGKGSDQYLPEFLTSDEIQEFGEELDKFRSAFFKKEMLPQVRPFPRVRDLFLRIRADGKGIALASSGKSEEVDAYTRLCDIEDLVDAQVTSDDADSSKPAPDVFEVSLKKLRVDPSRAVAVGDTRFDAESAGTAGVAAIGLLCGGTQLEDLQAAGMIAIYQHPADLLGRYETSPLAG
jgi:HAD superfamily hydrolase (TIGR01509 family)